MSDHPTLFSRRSEMIPLPRSSRADMLFTADGQIKLPRMTNLAISLAARHGGCLTRQPTRERVEAVMEAVADRVAARGFGMVIRPAAEVCGTCSTNTGETYGLYLSEL